MVRLLSKMNPISWVMEAIAEELPDVKVPSLAPMTKALQGVVRDTADKGLSDLMRLFDTLARELVNVINNPNEFFRALATALKSVAWTAFDTVKNLTLALYDGLTVLVRELKLLLTGVWKLGCFTEAWEDLTGTEFTLLNFFTYGPAVALNFLSVSITGEHPKNYIGDLDVSGIQIPRLYKSKQGVNKQILVSNMAERSVAMPPSNSAPLSSRELHRTTKVTPVSNMVERSVVMPPSNSAPVSSNKAQQPLAPYSTDIFADRSSANSAPSNSKKPNDPAPSEGHPFLHDMAIVFENLSRGFIAMMMQIETMDAGDQARQNEAPRSFTEKANPGGLPDPPYVLARTVPAFVHGLMLISATLTRDSGWKDVDYGVLSCALFELVASTVVFAKKDGDFLATAAEVVAEAGTIVRCFAEDDFKQGYCFVPSASCALVGWVAGQTRNPVGQVTQFCLFYPDFFSNIGGIAWIATEGIFGGRWK